MKTSPLHQSSLCYQGVSMQKRFTEDELTDPPGDDAIEALRRRLGKLDQRQISAWREMSPARRLEIAFQLTSSLLTLCA